MEVKTYLFICHTINAASIKEGLPELVKDIFGVQKQKFKAKVAAHDFIRRDIAYSFEDGVFVGVVMIEDEREHGIQ